MNKIILTLTLPLLFLHGCSSTLHNKFLDLCANDSVDDISAMDPIITNGFYIEANISSNFWTTALLRWNYDYVEYCIDETDTDDIVKTPGCYKFSKSDIFNNCNEGISKKYAHYKVYENFFKSRCINIEKIETSKSTYHYLSTEKDYILNDGDLNEKITKRIQTVSNAKNSTTVASSQKYLYYSYNPIAGIVTSKYCPTNPHYDYHGWYWLHKYNISPIINPDLALNTKGQYDSLKKSTQYFVKCEYDKAINAADEALTIGELKDSIPFLSNLYIKAKSQKLLSQTEGLNKTYLILIAHDKNISNINQAKHAVDKLVAIPNACK